MNCSEFIYAGLGACKAFRERVIGVIITNKGTVITAADAAVLTNWQTILAGVAGETGIYVPFDRGYQNNTTEPEITQSNLGYSEKTFDYPPMIKGFGDMSYCDYKTFFNADGQEFDIWLVLKDGTLEGTRVQGTQNLKGYRGKVFVNYNAPNADNLQESFPIDISFRDVEEWKANSTQVATNFTIPNLMDVVPVGLTVRVLTPYAVGGDITVKVTKRCQADGAYADLDAVANWPVKSVDADLDVQVTAVDATSAALGIYVLTIQKDAGSVPADLTGNVVIQGQDDDATYKTYLTQPLVVEPA